MTIATEKQEPKKTLFKEGAFGYQILINEEDRTFELIFDSKQVHLPETLMVIMVLLKDKITQIVENEKQNVSLINIKKYDPRLAMTKTMYNKHIHMIELLNKYIAEVAKGLQWPSPETIEAKRHEDIRIWIKANAPEEYHNTSLDEIPEYVFNDTQKIQRNTILGIVNGVGNESEILPIIESNDDVQRKTESEA